jgi:hypothetical protein
MILLISAFSVARIIGVSPGQAVLFKEAKKLYYLWEFDIAKNADRSINDISGEEETTVRL